MEFEKLQKIFSAICIFSAILVVSFAVKAEESAPIIDDPVAAEGRAYAHKKHQGKVTPFLLLNSFEFSDRRSRLGAGVTVVAFSSDLVLFDVCATYWPTGFKTSLGETYVDYLALPLSFKFFLLESDWTNIGPYISLGLAEKFLLSADKFENKLHDAATVFRFGLGWVVPSKMKNSVVLELIGARSLTPYMKSENVDRNSLAFSVGLTL